MGVTFRLHEGTEKLHVDWSFIERKINKVRRASNKRSRGPAAAWAGEWVTPRSPGPKFQAKAKGTRLVPKGSGDDERR